MKLIKIRMRNWKCFIDKTFEFKNGENILNLPNGSGKSSLVEAIIFSLFDQRPAGYDFNTLRNDQNQQCIIELWFSDNEENEIKIVREFGLKSNFLIYKNNELIGSNRTDNLNIINNIVPQKIVEGLWCKDSLAKSFILDSNYLFSILDIIFYEPIEIKKYLQTEKTSIQRQINNLKNQIQYPNLDESIGKKIEKKIKIIENSIKNKVFTQDKDLTMANLCKQKTEELNNLNKEIQNFDKNKILDKDIINNFLLETNINVNDNNCSEKLKEFFNNIEEKLSKEKEKLNNSNPLLKYSLPTIKNLINESKNNGKCILCGGIFNEEHESNLLQIINKEEANTNLIEKLENKLKLKEINLDDVIYSKNFYELNEKINDINKILNSCKNWKEILNNYNEENNKMYKELEDLKNKQELFNKEFIKIQELLKAEKEVKETLEQIKIVDEYMQQAKEYYSMTLTKNASEILNKINPRYNNIIMDNNKYNVIVMDHNLTDSNYLPVVMLSSGEKTLVAISLIIAAQKLFAPGLPLIFDESFTNLDRDNIIGLKNIFRDLNIQNFIISHDPIWLEN